MTLRSSVSLMYNHFPFMAPTRTQQDDYYAQMQSAQKSGGDDKKPLKLKLKTVIKKSETTDDPPSSEVYEEVSIGESARGGAPKSRLVEREHAGE